MIPKLTNMRLGVTRACPRLPPAYPLALTYAYKAVVSETGIVVTFPDFPNEQGAGNVYEAVDQVAHRVLAEILQRCFVSNDMIPLPAATEGDRASVPEYIALEILRRNWNVALVYREAREKFDEQQRDVIRKAAKSKKEASNDSDSAQAV